jgi:CBS domain-containing protein
MVGEVVANRPVPTIQSSATAHQAAGTMKKFSSSAVLIVDSGRLKGICTERDIVFGIVAEGLDPHHTRVDAVMTRKLQTVGPDRPLGHALHLMYEGRFRHVPVVDAKGHAVGLLCASDALDSDCLELEKDLIRREDIGAIL